MKRAKYFLSLSSNCKPLTYLTKQFFKTSGLIVIAIEVACRANAQDDVRKKVAGFQWGNHPNLSDGWSTSIPKLQFSF